MQEEIENRTVNLVVSTLRLTVRTLVSALQKYLNSRKNSRMTKRNEKRQVRTAGRAEKERIRVRKVEEGPQGRQTVRQLMSSGKEIHRVPVNTEHFREFRRILDKYGVDFAVTKGIFEGRPRYLVFFKAKDEQLLDSVLKECTARQLGVKREAARPSVLKMLAQLKGLMPETPKKIHQKERNISR